MPPKQKQSQKREELKTNEPEDKIKFVKIHEYSQSSSIENSGKLKNGYLIEKMFQILDSKGKDTTITRETFVKKMNKYSENFKEDGKFQIATFFENVGWRSVNGGHMIGHGEDCAKYIFSGEYNDGEWTDLGDVSAFTIMFYPNTIEK